MRAITVALLCAILAVSRTLPALATGAAAAPSPAPTPHVTVGVYTVAAFHTYGVNATGALDTPTGVDGSSATSNCRFATLADSLQLRD